MLINEQNYCKNIHPPQKGGFFYVKFLITFNQHKEKHQNNQLTLSN